ncbi:MAG TPA: DegT/DnrJ/EryC1/StrS aminotransferase family protein [Afifellaceae bacterium]|nr:DegT/DnrJ/EryC1/StrS aminotransferase family protein [Afifellaceae bacterium]
MTKPIAFIDLASQRDRLRQDIDAAIARVLDHGAFIMGPEVERLEAELSAFAGIAETVSCSSGTDALVLPLMAWEIGPGDAVFLPSFTFAATGEAVALVGATPVFVEVLPDTFAIDPAALAAAIEEVRRAGRLTPRAVIAVDLFGQPADYRLIQPLCREHGLRLIADAAQAFGATLDGRQAGHWADAVAVSFYPAKPLGCYGDGGAVQTNDASLAERMRSLRVHGQGADKYDNVRIGLNARMDTIQAAILLEKLAIFPQELELRDAAARRYEEALADVVRTPRVLDGGRSTWAQYTLLIADGGRDAFAAEMRARGVPTAIHYAKPLHRQLAFEKSLVAGGELPVTDDLCRSVISLPMHAYLERDDQDRIVETVRRSLALTRMAA